MYWYLFLQSMLYGHSKNLTYFVEYENFYLQYKIVLKIRGLADQIVTNGDAHRRLIFVFGTESVLKHQSRNNNLVKARF